MSNQYGGIVLHSLMSKKEFIDWAKSLHEAPSHWTALTIMDSLRKLYVITQITAAGCGYMVTVWRGNKCWNKSCQEDWQVRPTLCDLLSEIAQELADSFADE